MARLVGLQKAAVLVAEDDPQVLDVVIRVLRKAGYHAIPARDGREAWDIFQRAQPPIDFVVADVVMPHMTGTPSSTAPCRCGTLDKIGGAL